MTVVHSVPNVPVHQQYQQPLGPVGMVTKDALFGKDLKALLLEPANLPEIPDESSLLQAVVDKVGPFADQNKLLCHLRASRGKVHWAVNSYLREVLASTCKGDREDFDPLTQNTPQQHASSLDQVQQQQHIVTSRQSDDDSSSMQQAMPAGVASIQLDDLPANVLEALLCYLDLRSLLRVACSCQALHKASQSEQLWHRLFIQHWGAVIFPTSTCGGSCSSSSSSSSCSMLRSRSSTSAPAHSHQHAVTGHNADAVGATSMTGPQTTAASAAFTTRTRSHQPVPSWDVPAGPSSAPTQSAGMRPLPTMHGLQTQQQDQHDTSHDQQMQQQHTCAHDLAVRHESGSVSPQPFRSPALTPPAPPQHSVAAEDPEATLPAASVVAAQVAPIATGQSSRINAVFAYKGPAAVPQQPQSTSTQDPSTKMLIQQQQQQQQPGAVVAPAGSWQLQFKKQYKYQVSRTCPKCGTSVLLPIVYGFPSTALLEGMAAKRLVLGGDHLIDSCHVWACGGCRTAFRFFPYVNVQLWLQDEAQQMRQEHARAGAADSSSLLASPLPQAGSVQVTAAGGGDGGGSPAAAAQQQGQSAADGVDVHSNGMAAEGFPRYTYEL